jgi:hypothetical protein
VRTTLTIDDDLLAELKKIAHRERLPLKHVVHRTLRAGLQSFRTPPRRRPYRATTHSMGQARIPDLDKALHIAAALEDDEIGRKLALRK